MSDSPSQVTIESQTKPKNFGARLGAVVFWVISVAVFGSLILNLVTGFITVTVVNGQSMLPTFEPGDAVFVMKTDSYELGDVIVYHPDDLSCARCNIIHRIVGGDAESGWITRGDNNDFDDSWRPTTHEIIGKEWFYLKVGFVTPMLISPYLWITLFTAGLALFFGSIAWSKLKQERMSEPPQEVTTDE